MDRQMMNVMRLIDYYYAMHAITQKMARKPSLSNS